MPKWKKNATEFTVNVNYNESRGYQSSIPKPIIEALGEPHSIKFIINGKNIKLVSANNKIEAKKREIS